MDAGKISQFSARLWAFVIALAFLIVTFLIFGGGVSRALPDLLGQWAWKSKAPSSILVIMVENLGFNSFSCGEGAEFEPGSGLQIFCEESVRFTHAYTPSLMTQATIASIMTAKLPHEHGVRHNGAQALNAKEFTLAEAALAKNFRTSFFSGGPPVFRRSAINQGFEFFDDSFNLNYRRLYRPAGEMVALFLNWQKGEAANPFLSFLYLADSQFIDVPTTNELGEVRENSYHSQLDVVDEAMGSLARELKKRRVWDDTEIILLGVNGNPTDAHEREIPMMDLYSDRTRVALMIKPARKNREGPYNWKIDANVSLVDVGATLFERLGFPTVGVKPRRAFAPVSLTSVLTGPEPSWPEDREVISESAWSEWRTLSGVRVALRKGPFLYLFDERDRLYNTLTDSFEVTPLPRKEDLPASTQKSMARLLETEGFVAWHPVASIEIDKTTLGRELWRARSPEPETLASFRALAKKFPEDLELRGWRALLALRRADWRELKAAARSGVNSVPVAWAPIANFVALKNLGEKTTLPEDPCLSFLKPEGDRKVARECERPGIHDLVNWANESLPEPDRARAMESFLRFYSQQTLETRVAEYNEVSGRAWDTPVEVHSPEEHELILALPEMKKVRAIVKARIEKLNR